MLYSLLELINASFSCSDKYCWCYYMYLMLVHSNVWDVCNAQPSTRMNYTFDQGYAYPRILCYKWFIFKIQYEKFLAWLLIQSVNRKYLKLCFFTSILSIQKYFLLFFFLSKVLNILFFLWKEKGKSLLENPMSTVWIQDIWARLMVSAHIGSHRFSCTSHSLFICAG